ncbi:MAG: exonuclease domain-containing protein [Psychromonas sp.]
MLAHYLIKMDLHYQARKAKYNAIRAYQHSLLPLLNLSINDAPLLALDLEMTGLNPKQDQIISIGIIPIINGQIKLSKGQHKLIKIAGSVGQSATIHGLVDADLKQAVSLEQALPWLLQALEGHVLIAHHAQLDISFIQQALAQQTNNMSAKRLHLYSIDTLRIEHRRLLRKQPMIKEGELRLNNCRSRYNLPSYDAHNALVDALSCAELLLAQVSQMGGAKKIKVSDLIR